jgi:hypothetical protein
VNTIETQGDTAFLGVSAHGYYGVPRVDYISMHGGDGHMHNVPVDWTEYIPESRESTVKLTANGENADEIHIANGVFATVL